ncbi:hypothetical protein BO443_270016 [Burkholderia orbicola]
MIKLFFQRVLEAGVELTFYGRCRSRREGGNAARKGLGLGS